MKVLISGAGIAGPTLAYWLERRGFEVTIIEKAPALRTSGYMIDFWGAGFDIAERMGLTDELKRIGYLVRDVMVVDRGGQRVAGFQADAFARIAHGRYISMPRGDLAAAIFRNIEGRVETIFGDSIERLHQSGTGVRVHLESGHVRDFDVVIGADGLHSRVRELAFGPEIRFEKYLGYKVAAFHIAEYEPRNELTYVMYTQVGQQVGRFSMRDGRTMFLFTFADENPDLPRTRAEQEGLLRQRFGNAGWECPQILAAMPKVDSLYFDRVSQIRA
jgi:2-polyprenyl-6-methoxyphenol hydroxylase-like FAD-dependent oxidoreductase